jgi:hypothetical protein
MEIKFRLSTQYRISLTSVSAGYSQDFPSLISGITSAVFTTSINYVRPYLQDAFQYLATTFANRYRSEGLRRQFPRPSKLHVTYDRMLTMWWRYSEHLQRSSPSLIGRLYGPVEFGMPIICHRKEQETASLKMDSCKFVKQLVLVSFTRFNLSWDITYF